MHPPRNLNAPQGSKKSLGEYVFIDSDLPDVLKFVDRFRSDYLGIKEPYEIRMPVDDYTENTDLLEIPVDNTEDGDTLPMEIEDNTEESLVDDVTDEPVEPQSEEDLLNPEEKKDEKKDEKTEEEEEDEEEDDDEGF